jgi:Asp-tRNA(Asn)/Glu-tRNA(Gln) amidotransferase A subunit family amidase
MPNIYLEKNLVELNTGLKSKDFSFSELADETIKVIESLEQHTHAWVEYDLIKLKKLALVLDEQRLSESNFGSLTGIPFGIKDIFNTKDFKTQMGSPIWKNFSPGNNARVVDSLLNGGGLIVGKTVTAEFAVHALNETVNPHDITKTPGTSSSGSAAAVATGMVPFALASQTAGSISRPASFCGVWGMKPSFGMIPRTGVLKTTDSLDSIGFLAAHGKSLRVLLDVVRVKGPNYPYVFKNVDSSSILNVKANKKWKIGFLETHTWESAKDYVKADFLKLINKISNCSDIEIYKIDWPSEFSDAHKIHSVIYTKSLAYYFKQESKFSEEVSEVMQDMINEGAKIDIKDYQIALIKQENIIENMNILLNPYDFVISLGTSSSAPLRGEEELPDPSLIWTLSHIPSISAPLFRCPDGLPFGIQFIAARWNDYKLIEGVECLIDKGIIPPASMIVNI